MSQADLSLFNPLHAYRPLCAACGSPMDLTRIEPGTSDRDARNFACPKCSDEAAVLHFS